MSNGSLGTPTNPGFVDEGTSALTHHRPPGALVGPTATQIEQYAIQAARRLMAALDGVDTSDAIGGFLGRQSFSAGVVFGMAQNLAGGAVELVKLFRTLALAEYWESQHAQGFWEKFGHRAFDLSPIGNAMAIASLFWPDFDHLARQAHEERAVLFQTVSYAFEHPGEVFANIADEQKRKYEAFRKYRERHSMAGEFQAGVLFGELLLDVLMVIGSVTALARIATKIPGLLKLLPRLEELVPVLRRAPRIADVVEEAAVAPRRASAGRVRDVINPTGEATSPTPSRPVPKRNSPVGTDRRALAETRREEVASASTFRTLGLDRAAADRYLSTPDGQKLLGELSAADPTADAAKIYGRAVEQISSGTTVPIVEEATSPLVKIVPRGELVAPYSPYFTTAEELRAASNSGVPLGDYFGLPMRSDAMVYDIYEISPISPTNVFVSEVAPTSELGGLVTKPGGATQYLVPNRSAWSLPTRVGTIGN